MSAPEVHNGMVDMKPGVKLCNECRWWREPQHEGSSWRYDRCGAPQNVNGVNSVTGAPKPMWVYCEEMRESPLGCGPSAKWFEPRASEPQDFARDHGVNVGEAP